MTDQPKPTDNLNIDQFLENCRLLPIPERKKKLDAMASDLFTEIVSIKAQLEVKNLRREKSEPWIIRARNALAAKERQRKKIKEEFKRMMKIPHLSDCFVEEAKVWLKDEVFQQIMAHAQARRERHAKNRE